MSSRILRRTLLFLIVTALTTSFAQTAGQDTTEPQKEPVWEYRVVTLEPNECMSEAAMTTVLNANGRHGWELVGLQSGPPQFSGAAEGSVAMQPAAPNARNDLYPNLADALQGRVSLKMPQAQPSACQLVFKRKAGAK
jgi:hypothetical protein